MLILPFKKIKIVKEKIKKVPKFDSQLDNWKDRQMDRQTER